MAITSNTHHAYLNTSIVISNDGVVPVKLIDDISGDEFIVNRETPIKLCAGKHLLKDTNSSDSLTILVEDAIKIGGSKFKEGASFVSANIPWVFVTMMDRVYIYNQNTGESRVEYGVAPDEIVFSGNRDGNIFILRTDNDYTLLDVDKNEVLLFFQNMEYHNDHIVVYKDDDAVVVFDYISNLSLYRIDTEYSIHSPNDGQDDMLFFVSKEGVTCLNMRNDAVEKLNAIPGRIIGAIVEYFMLSGNIGSYHYCLVEKWIVFENCIVDLRKKKLFSINISGNPYVCKVIKKEYSTYADFKTDCQNFYNSTKESVKAHPRLRLASKCVSMEYLVEDGEELHLRYTVRSYHLICSDYISCGPIEYHDKNLNIGNDELLKYEDFQVSSTPSLPVKYDGEASNVLAFDQNSKIAIVERDDKLYTLTDCGDEQQILRDVYDATFCTNAFFTSDGKHVLLEKSVGVRDFFELDTYESYSFPIEGVANSRFLGSNGYKPLADHTMPWGADPVWIDPLTMRRVTPSALNTRSYISPNGLIQVKPSFTSVHFDNLRQADLSSKEYDEYCDKYNWYGEISGENKKRKIELRKALVKQHQETFDAQTAKYLHLSEDNPETVKKTLTSFIETKPEFTQLFVDRLDYVSCEDNGREKKALIGSTAWYLNYVSFSKDSRYMSFGAKMDSDFFRRSKDGVFVIYDLKDEKEVFRMDSTQGLWAVWTTQFSSRNDVACYDGQPKTYVKMRDSKEVITLAGRSFLCFSPSGSYMALSEQGYIDYTNHPNADWGHQPSTNVYIHPVDSSTVFNFLGPYSDLGDNISGTSKSTQRFNIASAAFSVDEKRLLMVGEDGVVVVRNLHLEEMPNSENVYDL